MQIESDQRLRVCYIHMNIDRAVAQTDIATTDVSSHLDEASQTLFRLGRAFGRMPMRELLEARGDRGVELSAIFVVQAVAAAERQRREATIGEVGVQLAVDPSTASRLVAQAMQSGFLSGSVSRTDGRARRLELTEAGRELETNAAQYQRAVFDAATSDWSEAERQEFARLFVRFAEAIVAALNDTRKP